MLHPILSAASLIFNAGRPLNPGGGSQYQRDSYSSDGVIELSENPTILVVEDEPLVAMVLESIIEDMGAFLVGPAASVEKALALIEAQVWVPTGRPFAALEPMAAATNGLVDGTTPLVEPGEAFTASFTLSVGEPP